jgi:hypothetical protein
LEQLANKISIVQQRQIGKNLKMSTNLVLTKENIGDRHGEGENAFEGFIFKF